MAQEVSSNKGVGTEISFVPAADVDTILEQRHEYFHKGIDSTTINFIDNDPGVHGFKWTHTHQPGVMVQIEFEISLVRNPIITGMTELDKTSITEIRNVCGDMAYKEWE
uniref:Uncharacterized protein n=1 Tax=Pristionchus pacificus TaxID=54126 RepID=A0A2A6CE03_PRIPA|eukprot:PDM76434.1 hypothetical protein PRIPAC_40038 [Pristionchus pacificus]